MFLCCTSIDEIPLHCAALKSKCTIRLENKGTILCVYRGNDSEESHTSPHCHLDDGRGGPKRECNPFFADCEDYLGTLLNRSTSDLAKYRAVRPSSVLKLLLQSFPGTTISPPPSLPAVTTTSAS